jgi:hypothetical protein
MSTNPRTVDEVFKDFKGRRSGMLKALTTGMSTGVLVDSRFIVAVVEENCSYWPDLILFCIQCVRLDRRNCG